MLRLLIVLASTTLACAATPADTSASSTGSDDGTTATPTTGEPAPTVAELASCDEVDLSPEFFIGPAFDPETGALLAPLPLPHIVATTAGWHAPEQREALDGQTTPVIMDVFTHEGLLGASFGLSEACGSARTLTLWRDEAARMKFVYGAVHSNAIKNGLQHMRGSETMHWTEATSDQPPTWAQVKQRLDEQRK
jgi:hypothetical protein